MYAIIETGGKQYRVEQGSRIQVESLPVEKGADITLDKVLLVATDAGIQVGKPTVAGATVTASVTTHDRGPKIIVFKKRSKKTSKRSMPNISSRSSANRRWTPSSFSRTSAFTILTAHRAMILARCSCRMAWCSTWRKPILSFSPAFRFIRLGLTRSTNWNAVSRVVRF